MYYKSPSPNQIHPPPPFILLPQLHPARRISFHFNSFLVFSRRSKNHLLIYLLTRVYSCFHFRRLCIPDETKGETKRECELNSPRWGGVYVVCMLYGWAALRKMEGRKEAGDVCMYVCMYVCSVPTGRFVGVAIVIGKVRREEKKRMDRRSRWCRKIGSMYLPTLE